MLGLTGYGIPRAIALAIVSGVTGVGAAYFGLCSNHKGATMQMFMYKKVYLGTTLPVIKW